MAKSTRSKVKRSFRAHKRETGAFAAADAARLHRLSAKLSKIASQPAPEVPTEEGVEDDGALGKDATHTNDVNMDGSVNESSSSTKISTHGPRNSRREQWRTSKGMEPRPKSRGMNRQGGIAAGRKAGRSKRRR